MTQPTATLILGNPAAISRNPKAHSFYSRIQKFLERLGYVVAVDAGLPYTTPKKSDLWIGHSRGADRLRFAPKGTKVLAFGSVHGGAINHPRDNTTQHSYNESVLPNDFHYVFTRAMRDAILSLIPEKGKGVTGTPFLLSKF